MKNVDTDIIYIHYYIHGCMNIYGKLWFLKLWIQRLFVVFLSWIRFMIVPLPLELCTEPLYECFLYFYRYVSRYSSYSISLSVPAIQVSLYYIELIIIYMKCAIQVEKRCTIQRSRSYKGAVILFLHGEECACVRVCVHILVDFSSL